MHFEKSELRLRASRYMKGNMCYTSRLRKVVVTVDFGILYEECVVFMLLVKSNRSVKPPAHICFSKVKLIDSNILFSMKFKSKILTLTVAR